MRTGSPAPLDGSPRMSLILSTLGEREGELARFVASVERQGIRVELIVVDQSVDGHVSLAANEWVLGGSGMVIRTIRSERGLSKGRNAGAALAVAPILGFPDDDCWYPDGLLNSVLEGFRLRPDVAAICGITQTSAGEPSLTRQWPRSGRVEARRVWRQGVEPAMFVRRELLKAVGGFDEELGVGAQTPFQSGEGTELILRAMSAGFHAWYDREVIVWHEDPVATVDAAARRRALMYGKGMGAVLRRSGSSPIVIVAAVARPLMGALVALGAGRCGVAGFRLCSFRGRLMGYLTGRRRGSVARPLV